MLDAERVPTTSYRVRPSSDDFYEVTTYPSTAKLTPTYITQGVYRMDALPRWIVEGMCILDVPGDDDVTVPNFGKKLGKTYWLTAQEVSIDALSHQIQDSTNGG